MTFQLAIAWFLTFFPITISPGPANLLLSSTAAQVGSRRTLPLMWDIVAVFALQIAVIGLGIGQIVFRFPQLFAIFQILGALYLFYLAYQFFRSSGLKQANKEVKLGFREGALLQFFNAKALTVPLIMYTQFLDPATSTPAQIIVLTVALAGLIIRYAAVSGAANCIVVVTLVFSAGLIFAID
ncbi:LysE family translocator [Candidatus Leptofilum sp.]|uniref:LysE family translocator n=1 Tax=Candidatus Leptofilum sp. TaxID=3241576 RepID=UPI003B59D7FF